MEINYVAQMGLNAYSCHWTRDARFPVSWMTLDTGHRGRRWSAQRSTSHIKEFADACGVSGVNGLANAHRVGVSKRPWHYKCYHR